MKAFPRSLPLLLFIAFLLGDHAANAAPKVIELWPDGVPGLREDAKPTRIENGRFFGIHYPDMCVHSPAEGKANGTAVIYVPGGAYERVAAGVGGGEISRWLTSLGITVFELHYRNKEYGYPAPLQDGIRAMRIVRSRADEFEVQPDRIGMLGGSAGGHVTSSVGTLFDAPVGKTGDPFDAVSARPDFMILIFPVITMMDPYAHDASRLNLIGDNPTDAVHRQMSIELQVTKDTSPAFIVSSQEDQTVPADNSILFYQAMCHAGVPGELHLYARGPHGSGMDSKLGPTSEWPQLCEHWMRYNGWLPVSSSSKSN